MEPQKIAQRKRAVHVADCRHGGTGTYDVMYVTYKIHSYDCNKCNYRRILSQEITGSKTQCLLTGEVY